LLCQKKFGLIIVFICIKNLSGFVNNNKMASSGTNENPLKLKTPSLTSKYEMYKAEKDGKEIIVCVVGKTILLYDYRCISDLHAMLKKQGEWIDLGGTDEQEETKDGTVEAWGRYSNNPFSSWYGLKKGLRGRFGVYIQPLLEKLDLAEITHEVKNIKIRAK
jgi:hypothetical protein